MRNLKRYLSIAIAIAMMVTLMAPAMAATETASMYSSEASKLNDMGLYKGIDTNTFNPDLASTLDRQTGAVMLLRMFGLEQEALATDESDAKATLSAKFKDAAKVAPWAVKQVAFAVDAGVIKGYPDGNFNPTGLLKGSEYCTLVLKQLGYEVPKFEEVGAQFATVAGLTATEAAAFGVNAAIKKDMLVGISFKALTINEDSKTTTLIDRLIKEGTVTEAAAVAAGIMFTPVVTKAPTSSVTPTVYATPTVAPTAGPAVGTVNVKIATDSPAEGNVDKGASVTALKLNLNSGVATDVYSVTVQRLGAVDATISSIRIFKGDVMVGTTTTTNNLSSGSVKIPVTAFALAANTDTALTVKAVVASGATASQSFKLSVSAMTFSSATVTAVGLPVAGNFFYVSSTTVGGDLSVSLASNNTAAATIQAGDWREVGRMVFSTGDQPARITTVAFGNAGTADLSVINGVRLKDVSTNAVHANATSAAGSLTITHATNIDDNIPANSTRTYIVEANVKATDAANGKTIIVRLDSIIGDNGTSATSKITSSGLPLLGNTMTVANNTSVTFTLSSNSPTAQTVARPAAGAVANDTVTNPSGLTVATGRVAYLVGTVRAEAGSSQDVTVTNLNVTMVATDVNVGGILDVPTLGVLGKNNEVLVATAAAPQTTTTVNLAVNALVEKGSYQEFKIYAMVDDAGTGVSPFAVKVITADSTATANGVAVTPLGSNVITNTLTVATKGAATITTATQPVAASVLKGQPNVKVYSYTLKAGNEPIVINTTADGLKLYAISPATGTVFARADGTAANGAATAGNGRIDITYKGSTTKLANAATVVNGGALAARGLTYTALNTTRIDANTSAKLDFYAPIGTDAVATSIKFCGFDTNASNVFGLTAGAITGYISGQQITPTDDSSYQKSEFLTVLSSGTVAITDGNTGLAAQNIGITVGANNGGGRYITGSFKVSAVDANESIRLTQVPFVMTGAGALGNKTVHVLDSNFDSIGSAVGAADSTVTVNSLIPKGTTKTFYLALQGTGTTWATADTTTAFGTKNTGNWIYRGESSEVSTTVATIAQLAAISGTLTPVDNITPTGNTLVVNGSSPSGYVTAGASVKLASFDFTTSTGDTEARSILTMVKAMALSSQATTNDLDSFQLKDTDGNVLAVGAGTFSGPMVSIVFDISAKGVNLTSSAKTLEVWGKLRVGEQKTITIPNVATCIQINGVDALVGTARTAPSVAGIQ